MARFNAFAACCLCLALMSGAMAARDLRGYGTTYSPPNTYNSPPVNTYQPGSYPPTGTSYPICTLSPPPFEVNNLDKSPGYGDFVACFDLSSKGYNGYDLAALQLVVSDKCYNYVKSVTFGGKKYEPELTRYTNEKSIGVKIGGKSLVTFKSLYTPVKVCITLEGVCASADSLYNTITYFPVYSANCATTTLYNPTPSPYSYTPNSYPSPVYESPSPVYTPSYKSPSPVYTPSYKSPSPAYKSPSPVYTPVYKSPSPEYVQPSPSPVYESPSPVYESPSPVYVYESPSPEYESPSPVYQSPSPVYESPSPVYQSPSPVYEQPSPSPVYESPSPVYTNVYKSPSPVYKSPSPAYTYKA